jgi:hypothetical protein
MNPSTVFTIGYYLVLSLTIDMVSVPAPSFEIWANIQNIFVQ